MSSTSRIAASPVISDEEIRILWAKVHRDGIKEVLFYDAEIDTEEDFFKLIESPYGHFYSITVDGEIAGMFWLNGWEGYAARVHYCFFREYYRRCMEIASEGLRHIFSMNRQDGTPYVKTLYGVTPVTNRLSIKFLQKCGFTVIGEVPDVCFIKRENASVAGVVSYITKEMADGRG